MPKNCRKAAYSAENSNKFEKKCMNWMDMRDKPIRELLLIEILVYRYKN